MALAICCVPPFTIGQPFRCAWIIRSIPAAELTILSKGSIPCAAIPAKRPFAFSPLNGFRARLPAGCNAHLAKRAIARGCEGKWKGPSTSSTIWGQSFTSGSTRFWYALSSSPRPDEVSCMEVTHCRRRAIIKRMGCSDSRGYKFQSEFFQGKRG